MYSQISLCDPVYDQSKGVNYSTNYTENNLKSIHNPTHGIYRTAIENTPNLGKRNCNEYKTIFDDVKYNVNYKNKTFRSVSKNVSKNNSTIRKDDNNTKIKSVFNALSKNKSSKK